MFWHASVHPSVCPQGGYPYPIMLCNITQNAMGQTPGGVPISHNALQHYPEFHATDTGVGGYHARSSGGVPHGGYPAGGTLLGGTLLGYPGRVPPGQVRMGGTLPGYPPQGTPTQPGQGGGTLLGGWYPGRGTPPGRVPSWPGQDGGVGGYPGRTTEGVLNTRWAVCLLRSRRRTFLFCLELYTV